MPVLAATNITHAYGEDPILAGVSLSIEPGEKIGLVGRNGAGKSTLLKILGGRIKQDSGNVALQQGCRTGYLEQDPTFDAGETLRGAAEAAFAELHRLHAELDRVYHEMADAAGEALERLLKRQAELERLMEAAGGYVVDHRIDETLHGLGFTDAQFTLAVPKLSGGQKARVALARLLLESPDVLLLDEPTNHLDIDGRLWLEAFLAKEYQGAVVMISHDRYLLDGVVDRILEVEQSRLIDYPGNYSTFRALRAERREAMARAYDKQQTQFKKEEAFIRRYKAGQRAKQARGRQWKLERAKESSTLERPSETGTFAFNLPKPERSGDIVVSVRGLSKTYLADDGTPKVLFNTLDLSIQRGERWGIIGPNGAGKTTLVRCMLKELHADAGTVQIGSRVSIGYFRQIQDDFNPDKAVYRHLQDVIAKENPGKPMTEQEARDLAGAFLFSGKEQDKELGLLSGGERARVFLAALLASSKNLIVLDEPTNHLDIPSAERLEDALSADGGYEGTMILISHDRALIDATCDHVLVLDGQGGARVVLGNYSDWAEVEERERRDHAIAEAERTRLAAEQARKRDQSARKDVGAKPAAKVVAPPLPDNSQKSKFSWMRLEQLEAKMAELSAQLQRFDAELADPEVYRDTTRLHEISAQREACKADLEIIEGEWLRKSV
ncbi:MAG: ABC-F family ATP-binding cassette domain-containing protein [Phycisphaeraceae bacterium]|nr:ABC-F family ATP-binding cassette domain-containing protein [Phycisphaeraceae bacterium]